MKINSRIAKAYNKGADFWHQTKKLSFENYSTSKDSKEGRHHLFIEKPAMYANIPDLKGKDVLCIGCGSGEECEYLLSKNPKSITGIDISKELIKIAKKNYPHVKFYTRDAEKLKFEANCFDFIYSSMVLDYFESWERLLKGITRVLKNGGTFLFSNIHPIRWGAELTYINNKKKAAMIGFDKGSGGGKLHIYGDYLNVRLHKKKWVENISLYYYTKPVSQMFSEIVESGLTVTKIIEPKAIPETKKYDKEYWELNQKIPNFIIFEAKKLNQIV